MCNYLVADDLNARVGTRLDFVENEYLFNLDMMSDDYEEDIVLHSVSQDKIAKENGICLLKFRKLTGMRIMNGRAGEDAGAGEYASV